MPGPPTPERRPLQRSAWRAVLAPRDLREHEAAEAAIRAMWRERRADRLEAIVLGYQATASRLAGTAEARAAKACCAA